MLVSDIRGFTEWSNNRDPIEVLAFLNIIQGAIAEVVRQHGGMVDKFMGDGMLAVFGAPTPLEHYQSKAVAAAKRMQEVVTQINARDGGGVLRLGIGVHSGKLVAGCLGSGMRMEFTILGDTVNTASRLETYTKEAGASVLLSQTTVDAVSDKDGLRRIGDVTLRGRDESLGIWTFATDDA